MLPSTPSDLPVLDGSYTTGLDALPTHTVTVTHLPKLFRWKSSIVADLLGLFLSRYSLKPHT